MFSSEHATSNSNRSSVQYVKAVQNINRTKISLQLTSILMIINNVNTTQNVAFYTATDMFCFRGGSPAGTGEDGRSAHPLFRAESQQSRRAAAAGAGPGGLQSLYFKPGGPSLVAGPH